MTKQSSDATTAVKPTSAPEPSPIEPVRPRPGRLQAAVADAQRAYEKLPEWERPRLTGWFRSD